jgi:hypothetical protein
MPLFNWGAPTTSEIVGNHFWIYWAVTGPLTIMTMTIVGYWILSRTQKNMNDKSSHSEEDSLVDENSQSNNRRPSRFESLKGKLKFIKKRQPKIEGV